MRLTPGQIAELRAPKNIRGGIVDGTLPRALYLVAVSYAVLERTQLLADAASLPEAMTWYVHQANPNRVELHTTHPEWFAELEGMIEDARRPQR